MNTTYDWRKPKVQELEDAELAAKYGGSVDQYGLPVFSNRKLQDYIDNPRLWWDDTINAAKMDTVGAFESLRPKYWDLKGKGVEVEAARQAADQLGDLKLQDMANKTGMSLDDARQNEAWRSLAKQYGDESIETAWKAGYYAPKGTTGAAKQAASVGMQALGKGLKVYGAVEPVVSAGYNISQGLNPAEAAVRSALGTGAFYLGSTFGGAAGTAVAPGPGTIAGGIAGGLSASWLTDKALDLIIGDDEIKIAKAQAEKANRQQSTQERQREQRENTQQLRSDLAMRSDPYAYISNLEQESPQMYNYKADAYLNPIQYGSNPWAGQSPQFEDRIEIPLGY